MNIKTLYQTENDKYRNTYETSIESIKAIVQKTQNPELYTEKKDFIRFFNDVGTFILKIYEFEKKCTPEYFSSESLSTLKEENKSFFESILPEKYETSWANPTYAVSKLGDQFGQLLCFLYARIRQYISCVFLHKKYEIATWNLVFIKAFKLIEDSLDYDTLRSVIVKINAKYEVISRQIRLLENYDPHSDYYKKIIEESDLSDERYLFQIGCYINEHTIRISKHLRKLTEEQIIKLADLMADSYERGFVTTNKDLSKKSTAMLVYPAGFERIIKHAIPAFKNKGIDIVVQKPFGARVNQQYEYDHRFDRALYLDNQFLETVKHNLKQAYELCKNYTDAYSGLVYIETFGEEPFSPKTKKECLKFNNDQQQLFQQLQQLTNQLSYSYTPRDETSFEIIAFPTPDIGKDFEKIFDETYAINTLKNEVYEPIQQKIIDALDTAEYVHIKGNGTNQTDLKIMHKKIDDPKSNKLCELHC